MELHVVDATKLPGTLVDIRERRREPPDPARPILMPGTILAILYVAAVILPLAVAALSGIEPAGAWSEAATAAGMIAAAMLFLQVISSGRFETLSGRVGIDVTMAFHKWMAKVMLAAVLLHPLLFLGPLLSGGAGGALDHLAGMVRSPRYLTGVVALLLLLAVVLLAILRDRLPVPYEAWRASHWGLALAALWSTMMHLLAVGSYSGEGPLLLLWWGLALAATAAALGVYTVRAWRMRRQGWRIAAKRRIAERLWEVTVCGAPGEALSFRAGQFAWLALAPRRFPLFDHPFSIASSPLAGGELRFLIREAGDFTAAIGAVPIGAAVGLDAPHGSFTLEGIEADAVLLVAGGVGVAPILGLLRDLAARGDPRPVRLVYGARAPAAMIAPEEFAPLLDRLSARAQFLVEAPAPGWAQGVGPVSGEPLAEALAGLDPARVAAMICGPGPMMSAVTDALHGLGVPLRNIRYERFDYAAAPASASDRRVTAGFRLTALALVAAAAVFALR